MSEENEVVFPKAEFEKVTAEIARNVGAFSATRVVELLATMIQEVEVRTTSEEGRKGAEAALSAVLFELGRIRDGLKAEQSA